MSLPPLGLDVAKLKFNACLVRQGGRLRHRVFTNDEAGFSQLSEWLSKIGNARLRKALYFAAVTALRCSPFFQSWAEAYEQEAKARWRSSGRRCASSSISPTACSRRAGPSTRSGENLLDN